MLRVKDEPRIVHTHKKKQARLKHDM